jgi:hypothetical protein
MKELVRPYILSSHAHNWFGSTYLRLSILNSKSWHIEVSEMPKLFFGLLGMRGSSSRCVVRNVTLPKFQLDQGKKKGIHSCAYLHVCAESVTNRTVSHPRKDQKRTFDKRDGVLDRTLQARETCMRCRLVLHDVQSRRERPPGHGCRISPHHTLASHRPPLIQDYIHVHRSSHHPSASIYNRQDRAPGRIDNVTVISWQRESPRHTMSSKDVRTTSSPARSGGMSSRPLMVKRLLPVRGKIFPTQQAMAGHSSTHGRRSLSSHRRDVPVPRPLAAGGCTSPSLPTTCSPPSSSHD